MSWDILIHPLTDVTCHTQFDHPLVHTIGLVTAGRPGSRRP